MRTPIRILMALVTVATLAVALPAAAAARPPVLLAPPGNSGITQYSEVVPSDQGATPPRAGGAPGNGPVTLAQQRRFDRLGADGRTLAAVAKATAPPPFSPSTKPSAASSVTAPIPPRELTAAGAPTAFASIADAALGPVGAIMLVSAVALVARGVRRRRANP
jgi:hypothetical protein